MSSFINKAKAKVEELASGNQNKSDTYGSSTNHPGYDNPHSSNAGPHSSNVANKGDPRVDSDYDHRNDPTSRVGGAGQTQPYGDNYGRASGPGGISTADTGSGTHAGHTGTTGSTGYTGSTAHTGGLSGAAAAGTGVGGAGTHYSTGTGNTYDNPQSTTAGPHNSNLTNKLDPRHDSDRDHRNDPTSRVGGYGTQGSDYGHTAGIGGTGVSHGTGTHTSGIGGTGASHSAGTGTLRDNPQSTTAGPHNSNLMNKLDPRHDSDRDHRNDPTSRVGGYGTQGGNYGHAPVHEATTHPTGSGYGTETTGEYGAGHTGSHGVGHTGSHGVGHTGTYGTGHTTGTTGGYGDSSYTPGSGNASNTAGPHNSNLLNKLDPRVDSDLDGSKTYGGNQTHR